MANDIIIRIGAKDDASAAFKKINEQLNGLDAAGKKASGGIGSLVSGFGALKGAMAAFAGAAVVREMFQMMDAWTQMTNRLKVVTVGTSELTRVQEKLYRLSRETRTEMSSVVNLYSRMARSTQQLGLSETQLMKVTENINKAFVVSGASSTEAASAILQLGQAFASGKLAGDEFRSVMEQAPRLAQAIADNLGVTIGALYKLRTEGKLTTEVVIQALLDVKNLDEEFASTSATMAQGATAVGDAFTKMTASFDKAFNISGKLASALYAVAKAADRISEGGEDEGNGFPLLAGRRGTTGFAGIGGGMRGRGSFGINLGALSRQQGIIGDAHTRGLASYSEWMQANAVRPFNEYLTGRPARQEALPFEERYSEDQPAAWVGDTTAELDKGLKTLKQYEDETKRIRDLWDETQKAVMKAKPRLFPETQGQTGGGIVGALVRGDASEVERQTTASVRALEQGMVPAIETLNLRRDEARITNAWRRMAHNINRYFSGPAGVFPSIATGFVEFRESLGTFSSQIRDSVMAGLQTMRTGFQDAFHNLIFGPEQEAEMERSADMIREILEIVPNLNLSEIFRGGTLANATMDQLDALFEAALSYDLPNDVTAHLELLRSQMFGVFASPTTANKNNLVTGLNDVLDELDRSTGVYERFKRFGGDLIDATVDGLDVTLSTALGDALMRGVGLAIDRAAAPVGAAMMAVGDTMVSLIRTGMRPLVTGASALLSEFGTTLLESPMGTFLSAGGAMAREVVKGITNALSTAANTVMSWVRRAFGSNEAGGGLTATAQGQLNSQGVTMGDRVAHGMASGMYSYLAGLSLQAMGLNIPNEIVIGVSVASTGLGALAEGSQFWTGIESRWQTALAAGTIAAGVGNLIGDEVTAAYMGAGAAMGTTLGPLLSDSISSGMGGVIGALSGGLMSWLTRDSGAEAAQRNLPQFSSYIAGQGGIEDVMAAITESGLSAQTYFEDVAGLPRIGELLHDFEYQDYIEALFLAQGYNGLEAHYLAMMFADPSSFESLRRTAEFNGLGSAEGSVYTRVSNDPTLADLAAGSGSGTPGGSSVPPDTSGATVTNPPPMNIQLGAQSIADQLQSFRISTATLRAIGAQNISSVLSLLDSAGYHEWVTGTAGSILAQIAGGGGDPGGWLAQQYQGLTGSLIVAGGGFSGTVNRATHIIAGEAGAEDVLIRPRSQGGISGGISITNVFQIGSGNGDEALVRLIKTKVMPDINRSVQRSITQAARLGHLELDDRMVRTVLQ